MSDVVVLGQVSNNKPMRRTRIQEKGRQKAQRPKLTPTWAISGVFVEAMPAAKGALSAIGAHNVKSKTYMRQHHRPIPMNG